MSQAVTNAAPQLRSRKARMVPGGSDSEQHSPPQHDTQLRTPDSDTTSPSITSEGRNNRNEAVLVGIKNTELMTENVTLSESEEDRGGEGDADVQPLLDGEKVVVVGREEEEEEGWMSIMVQVLLPYIVAGFGMVAAGMVLDLVQHTEVFSTVTELFILVPALLGLKGNLEMTLASRLSTQANLGHMDTYHDKLSMILGNLALVQAQATVVGFLASVFAMVMGWIPKGRFPLDHALLLCASSIFTAAVASFVLGCLMVGVVLLSRRLQVNPDNIATPIAASLGDLITLSLLAAVSSLLFRSLGNTEWLAPAIMGFFFLLLPVWLVVAVRNQYTRSVVYNGWTPVLCAMVISSVGGVILDFAVTKFHGLAIFQPVINGVGGNLVAVQASRISTWLHRRGKPGQRVEGMPASCVNPFTFLCANTLNARAARVLLLLVVPGHLIFVYTIYYLQAGHTSVTLLFNLFYLSAALLQVMLLLYLAEWLVQYIWLGGHDPDNMAIPYLTAVGDLLGTAFLTLAFYALYCIGDRDSDVGD